jgi:hypothetical protein
MNMLFATNYESMNDVGRLGKRQRVDMPPPQVQAPVPGRRRKLECVRASSLGHMRWRTVPAACLERLLCSKQGVSISDAVFPKRHQEVAWCPPTSQTVIRSSPELRGKPASVFRAHAQLNGYVTAVAIHAQRGNDNVMVLVSSDRKTALVDWPLPVGQTRDHTHKPIIHAPEMLHLDRALFIITSKDSAPSWTRITTNAPHQVKDIMRVFHGLRHVVLFDEDDVDLTLDGPGLWRSPECARQMDVPLETGLRVAYITWAISLAFRPPRLPVMNPTYYNTRLQQKGLDRITVGQACLEILQHPKANEPVIMITTLSSRWGNALWWVDVTARAVSALHADVLRLCIIRMPRIHEPVMDQPAENRVCFGNRVCAINTLEEIFTSGVFVVRGVTNWSVAQRLSRMPAVADSWHSDPTLNSLPPPHMSFATVPIIATDKLMLFRTVMSMLRRRHTVSGKYPSTDITSIPRRIGIGDQWMYNTSTLSAVLSWLIPTITCPAHGVPGTRSARVPRLADRSGWGIQERMPPCFGIDGELHASGRLALARRVYGSGAPMFIATHLLPGGKSDEQVHRNTRAWVQQHATPDKDRGSWIAKESMLRMIKAVQDAELGDKEPARDSRNDNSNDPERGPITPLLNGIPIPLDLSSRHLAFAIRYEPKLMHVRHGVMIPDTHPVGSLPSHAIIGGVPLAGVVLDDPCHCGMITFMIHNSNKPTLTRGTSDTVLDSMGTVHCRHSNETGVNIQNPAQQHLLSAMLRTRAVQTSTPRYTRAENARSICAQVVATLNTQ